MKMHPSTKKRRNSGMTRIFDNEFSEWGDQVLLYNSKLKLFPGKLKSRWSGPFTVSQVFPYGTVELYHPTKENFKVNGQRIKHYVEDFPTAKESIELAFPE